MKKKIYCTYLAHVICKYIYYMHSLLFYMFLLFSFALVVPFGEFNEFSLNSRLRDINVYSAQHFQSISAKLIFYI